MTTDGQLNSPDVSVIICAHNPRQAYLQRTLDALRGQGLPKDKWEFILVDNASSPPLADTVDLSWHPLARHVLERELGLSPARLRGIAEAKGDLLVFVDDDNVLEPGYLSETLRIAAEWPRLGAWGSGAIIPEFELEPVDYIKPLIPYLALRHVTKAAWTNVFPCVEATPWGAGLCIRRSVADAYRQMSGASEISISGRRGRQTLLSGDDVEICYVACDNGLGMGIFPELKLTHLIAKERVAPQYLLKIFEGTSTSNFLLAYKWKGDIPKSPLRPWGLLSVLKNIVIQRGLDRQKYLASIRAAISARRIIRSAQQTDNRT